MVKAIVITEAGGPEVLKWQAYDPGFPGRGEVLVRHEAVGLNFIDIYHRSGLYPLPALPAVPGMEELYRKAGRFAGACPRPDRSR